MENQVGKDRILACETEVTWLGNGGIVMIFELIYSHNSGIFEYETKKSIVCSQHSAGSESMYDTTLF